MEDILLQIYIPRFLQRWLSLKHQRLLNMKLTLTDSHLCGTNRPLKIYLLIVHQDIERTKKIFNV